MPYTLITTNGTTLTTVQDGTVDNSTSLTFVGKNFTGYGDPVNENFVRLLENFSNTIPPTNPITGQVWFDTSSGKLKLYNGTLFKQLATITTGTSAPIGAVSGDLYFNGSLFYAYTGNTWLPIGPLSNNSGGNAALPSVTVLNADGGTNTVVPILLGGNTATVISTASSYSVSSTDPLYNSFQGIYPGINLPNTSNTATNGSIPDTRGVSAYYDGNSTYGNLFWGTAGSSLGLVDYTNSIKRILRSTDFITKDSLSQLGALSVNDDGGITINNVFQLHVTRDTGIAESNISNIRNNVIKFNINDISNGTYTNFINFDARSGFFQVLPTTSTGVSIGSSAVNSGFLNIYGTNFYGTSYNASTLTSIFVSATNIVSTNLTVTNTIVANAIQLSATSTINGANILTTSTLYDNSQLSNGSGYLTSSTVLRYVIGNVNGTTGQLITTTTSGTVTISLADTVSLDNVTAAGAINASAMYVQGSPVLTAASFTGTGVTAVSGTANQITSLTSGTQVILSLPSSMSVTSLDGAALSVNGVPVLTVGNAVSSLYPGTTGLLLNGSASLATGAITLSGILNAGNGGTGQGTYNTGDMLYAGSTNPSYLSRLSAASAGNALISQGTSAIPAWGKIDLTQHITNTLQPTNGGTGVAGSLTGYTYANGTNPMTASSTIPGTSISGNIPGNSANITAFTINQNVGTGNSPTFNGITVNGTATFSGQVGVSSATVATSAVNLGQYAFGRSATGYSKFPNGLILQWGNLSSTGGTFNYPIAFPNAALQLFASNTNAQGSFVDNAYGYVISTTQFYLATKSSSGSGSTEYPCAWFAIGY